ncbi:MAG: hypothetical protein GY788_27100, partial [bacterium]|nr:hypothetical protein [bacterium]
FGASPLCKGGYQDARLQLAEAARQLDATEAERDEWKAMTKVADRALARLARLAAFAIEHGGSGRTVEAHRAWRLATRTFGKLAALGVARRGR